MELSTIAEEIVPREVANDRKMTNSWTRQKRLGVGDQHLVKVAKSASKLYPFMAGNGTAYHTFPGEVELTSLLESSFNSQSMARPTSIHQSLPNRHPT